MKCYIKHSDLKTTKKTKGLRVAIQVKFGRSTIVTHKTDLRADKEDLECFNLDGSLKSRVKRHSAIILHSQIQKEFDKCTEMFNQIIARGVKLEEITTELFNKEFHRDEIIEEEIKQEHGFNKLLEQYIEEREQDLARHTLNQYFLLYNVMQRFLVIECLTTMTIEEFTPAIAIKFSNFYENEYKYVQRYSHLYEHLDDRNVPKVPRSRNTVAQKNQQLKTFFTYMQGNGVVTTNPYLSTMVKTSKIMKERYDNAPIVLTQRELSQLVATDVPERLQQTKDAFLVQCSIGARISDFRKLSKANIRITQDGIPYFEYVAQKTAGTLGRMKRQYAPIVRFVFDILKKYDFQLKILNNISGKSGYNKKLKQVCELAKLDRRVTTFDSLGNIVSQKLLYELVSSHTARRVCQSLMKRYAINDDFLSLHVAGSNSIERYIDVESEIVQSFNIMNVIFNQQAYKVDQNLNII